MTGVVKIQSHLLTLGDPDGRDLRVFHWQPSQSNDKLHHSQQVIKGTILMADENQPTLDFGTVQLALVKAAGIITRITKEPSDFIAVKYRVHKLSESLIKKTFPALSAAVGQPHVVFHLVDKPDLRERSVGENEVDL
jgi:hypothetical protein